MRRAALVAVLALAAVAAASAAPERSELRARPFASGFEAPIYLTYAPGQPNTVYVVEQAGRVIALTNGRKRVFLDIRDRITSGGEQGLLSVAFHPRYASNRRYYVNYTDRSGDTRVVEFRAGSTNGRELLFVDQPYSNHNGGQLQFGPDGKLYVGMGDGGSGGDPHDHGQNLDSRLAKMLRIDPLRAGADWEMVGYGLRNPWRFSFDRRTGDLWVSDVGQGEWEEISFRTRAQLPRRWNYGWAAYEGRERFKNIPLNANAPYVPPIHQYSHDDGACSVTGGYVYRGSAVKSAVGRYFFGDYCNGAVWSLKGRSVRREPFTIGSLASFGEDARGELYLVSQGGTIYKLAN